MLNSPYPQNMDQIQSVRLLFTSLTLIFTPSIMCVGILSAVTGYIQRKSWLGSCDKATLWARLAALCSQSQSTTKNIWTLCSWHFTQYTLWLKENIISCSYSNQSCLPAWRTESFIVICSCHLFPLQALSAFNIFVVFSEVIFSWKSSALSVSASIALHQWPKNSELSGMYQDSW